MKITFLRAAFFACAAFALAGCEEIDMVKDATSNWFNSPKKSNIKGERISVISEDTSLKPDPDLAKTDVVLPPPYANSEWPQAGGYATNAMYHLEASGPLHVIWQQDAGKGSDDDSRLTAPPIVAGGRVYVLDAEAHVFAFNAGDGKPLWDKELAPKGGSGPFLGMFGSDHSIDPTKGFGGGVAYEDGKIFVSTGFGDVFAFDAASGKKIWKVNLGVPIVNAPVANGGRVFVSTQDNHFFALAEMDGRTLWDNQGISESAGILESTSAAVSGGVVIVPYTSGELYAMNVDSGRLAWNDMLSRNGTVTALSELDDIAGRPVIDRDMVFAISHSGIMVAINLNTGDRAWARDIGGIQTPWAAGDFLYVLATDGQVLCLTRKEGRIKWAHQLPRWTDPDDRNHPIVWAGPVLVSNRLILVSSDGFAASLSPYTGQLLGRMALPGGALIAPVVANGTMFVLTSDAQLVALR
ncbi:MAG TPA: PQQ-binding-like beta-propeller repeat protein [Rhizomicrobium sp.]|jgi:outer membrane protein assembly factor BamB|nr:PQQ-binding-like beta-propeller repeat protein [Rhizomicrobium sp.]